MKIITNEEREKIKEFAQWCQIMKPKIVFRPDATYVVIRSELE